MMGAVWTFFVCVLAVWLAKGSCVPVDKTIKLSDPVPQVKIDVQLEPSDPQPSPAAGRLTPAADGGGRNNGNSGGIFPGILSGVFPSGMFPSGVFPSGIFAGTGSGNAGSGNAGGGKRKCVVVAGRGTGNTGIVAGKGKNNCDIFAGNGEGNTDIVAGNGEGNTGIVAGNGAGNSGIFAGNGAGNTGIFAGLGNFAADAAGSSPNNGNHSAASST